MAESRLGHEDAIPGVSFAYGFAPSFAVPRIATAFNTVTFANEADNVVIFGNYTALSPPPHILFRQNTGRTLIYALGVIERLLLEAVTFDVTDDINAGDRSIVRYLRRQDSGSFPAAGQPLPAIQEIEEFSGNPPTGGTWDMIFTMQDESEVTVTHAYDDSVSEIQTNVDTVMAGEILSYTAGDIAITDPIGITNDIRITFSGNSVKHLHWELVQTDTSNFTGTDVGDFGPVTHIQYGHPARYGWSVLYNLGVVGTLPTDQMGTLPNTFDVRGPGSRPDYPPQYVVRALAEEMSFVEGNVNLKLQLFKELGIS